MNLPNKITFSRILLSFLIIIILLFPFDASGIELPKLFIDESIVIDLKYIVVNSIKMVAGSKGEVVAAIKSGKIKTACLMTGIVLTLFYNLPFELFNIRVSDALLIVACVLSIISAIQYYEMNKKYIFE